MKQYSTKSCEGKWFRYEGENLCALACNRIVIVIDKNDAYGIMTPFLGGDFYGDDPQYFMIAPIPPVWPDCLNEEVKKDDPDEGYGEYADYIAQMDYNLRVKMKAEFRRMFDALKKKPEVDAKEVAAV